MIIEKKTLIPWREIKRMSAISRTAKGEVSVQKKFNELLGEWIRERAARNGLTLIWTESSKADVVGISANESVTFAFRAETSGLYFWLESTGSLNLY